MPMAASPDDDCIAKPLSPPPPPPPPPLAVQKASYSSHNGHGAAAAAAGDQHELLDGTVVALRAAAAVMAFVGLALVASCRHGDWMEFTRYQEYRYLLGVCVVTSVYSSAQALRHLRRMRRAHHASNYSPSFLDFAGDQVVAYLLMTASSAALPITIRMRSAVVNVFTDAIAASISLAFLAFAALAASAALSGYALSSSAASAQTYY